MYSQSKYVIGHIDGQMQAVVFPETISHTEMRRLFDDIISAGFCHYQPEKVHVYGDSVGLKLKSRPEDARFVGRAMAHPNYII